MGRHRKEGEPITGDGHTGGKKPTWPDVHVRKADGVELPSQSSSLWKWFRRPKKK